MPDEAVHGNVFKQQAASLPTTLDTACAAMAAGCAEALFGADFSRAYLAVKEVELNDYHRQVTAWERQYLGFLV
ncbi:glutamine synthetase, type III [Chromobacterium violaceum]|uniref:Glutamine synthetase, type III n=1 Tax=Chromobacterium violaceum TaxID=536 RepID=A0A3S4LPK3_CHRVL|nr:glutamine synthetase, type III [Chromobacterium violaceum]